jgi:signal transduction histidine kinase/ligand-binding sensor domain-containing protein/DNA-binding response OmpR family regulator
MAFQVMAQENPIQFKKLDINDGLSSNLINTIFKDSRGYLWVGTVNGLNCYDGNTVKVYRKEEGKEGTLVNNSISRIFEDNRQRLLIITATGLSVFDPVYDRFSNDDSLFHKNIEIPKTDIVEVFLDKERNLLFITRAAGIFKYDSKKDIVSHFNTTFEVGETLSIITGASLGKDGNIWLINQNFDLIKFDPVSNTVKAIYPKVSDELQPSSYDHGVFADSKGIVWLFSRNEQEGLIKFDPTTRKVTIYKTEYSTNQISNNIIASVIEDASGNILVGTDHGGLNIINRVTGNIRVIQNDPGDKNSIAQNSTICLFLDDMNILWVGTYKKGISYYHPDLFKFSAYTQHPYKKNWLEYDDVNTFVEDRSGNLWIGTNGGGLVYFDRDNNTFKTYKHDPNNKNSLSSNVIVDLFLDHTGGLWIGTYMGGLNYFYGNNFKRFFHNPQDVNSISSDNIWSLFEDADHKLWVGTLGGGANCFSWQSGNLVRENIDMPSTFKTTNVMSIAGAHDQNVWFATVSGIACYSRTSKRITQFFNDPEKNSIVSNSTLDIYCDHRGLIWVGTREGLNILNPQTGKFTLLTERDGLPGNDILTILEDEKGNMWLGTPRGLCNLILSFKESGDFSFTVKNYDEKDGLHGKAFNEHAALKTRRGELVFGGADGFSIFKPENLNSEKITPKLVFSGFEVQNKPVDVGQEINKRILLPTSLNHVDHINLKYFEKTFSISFAALNFINPDKTLYHYKMEGFNSDWIVAGSSSRKVTYTNLHPGDYTFKVFASDIDNSLKSEEISLEIEVLPPFWRTKWAYSLYLILTLGLIFYSIQLIIKRERNKFLIQQERMETAKVHEMDMLKLKFFTNISHEIRTPLTLILSPLDRIIKTTENIQNKEQLRLIQRNAKRLLTLINQLLDFRRLEVQGLTLLLREEEFVSFCKEATESFSDLSESRNIQLTFNSNVEELMASFDYDKIEKILFNLLSNAFKFTHEGGKIGVTLQYDSNSGQDQRVKIIVCDTGIGVPDDKQELIFERFVQSLPEGSTVNKGSGIGLSLSKEFVQMHDGTIKVQSKVGEGSCFEVTLPLKEAFKIQMLSKETQLFESNHLSEMYTENNRSDSTKTSGLLKILLVEDNPDIRFYLKDNLKTDYQILEAINGFEAWDSILKEMPDLIVSDIMMPVMDGLELCRKVKTDNRTSHIPVILLTARTTDQQKYEGLETGADDYITKPFNFEVLELRIKNLIEQRRKLKQSFHKNLELQPSEISITSLDDKFLKKIKEITEKNMHEPNFSVEKLSSEFGISRAHLYNKLVALTGKTPIEYIRILRIRRAAQLLEKSQLTVMEIAYKVGFNDPRYFTKHFKSEYMMTPTEFAKKNYSPSNEKDIII